MKIIPIEFHNETNTFTISESELLELIEFALKNQNEIGGKFENGKLQIKTFDSWVPKEYRIHSHPNGIAFPSEGDIDLMINYVGGGVYHTIVGVRSDLKRAVIRSYNMKFQLERVLIKTEKGAYSEIRYKDGELLYLFEKRENVQMCIKNMCDFLHLQMPVRFNNMIINL